MNPVGIGTGPVAPKYRLWSPPRMLSLVLGSPQSGIYVLHELGIGPGSGCYRGGSVGRRGCLLGGWIIGKSIGAWVCDCGVVVGPPVTSTTGIWRWTARAVPYTCISTHQVMYLVLKDDTGNFRSLLWNIGIFRYYWKTDKVRAISDKYSSPGDYLTQFTV